VAEIVVTGVRASLQSAQAIKRNSVDIVDSIVAQDIGKLPDNTVGDALQRVTGVQITRAAGEAGTVLIRGLPNVTTEINGRDVFTAADRSVALSDIPAQLVSGVDVYKTLSADQLEGGIAGTINIRLRRPFDFPGLEAAGTVQGIYGDQRHAVDPNASFLLSNRWQTNIGEIGALLSVSYQKRRYTDETAFNFVSLPVTAANGSTILIPQTSGNIANVGDRERSGVNFSAQWRPKENLQFYLDSAFTGYRNQISSNYFIGIPGAGGLQSYTLEPGTNEVASLTSTNNFTLTSDQAYRDRTNTFQTATGGKWTEGRLTLTSDLSYTYSLYRTQNVILDTRFNAPTYTEQFNVNGTPHISLGGVNVLDASNFDLNQLFDNRTRQVGQESAFRVDGTYEIDNPVIHSITAGFRYAYRNAKSQATNGAGITTIGDVSAASLPGLGAASPSDFLGGDRDVGVTQWFNASSNYLFDNISTLRGLFGQPLGQQAFDPTKAFRADQNSYAGYVKANFGFDVKSFPVTGDFGVRLVQTDEEIVGSEHLALPNGTLASALTPLDATTSHHNALPSFNGKIGLTDTLFLRVSAGQTVSFADFSQLNPALSVTAINASGGTLQPTGTSGNANLKPIRSTNVDTSLEWYFSKSGSLTGTYFHRDINGYIQTYGVIQTINGIAYNIATPESAGSGVLQGLEAAYQQFYDFDFIPNVLKGFGSQLNFTYIDSYTMSPVATGDAPTRQALANVSRYSFNLIGLYERGPASVRVAYNWRSKDVIGFDAGGSQPQTIIQAPVGQLDLAASYAVTPRLVLTLDATNLMRAVTQNYFGSPLYPRDTDRSDRTVELGLRFRL
jgi:TonB-dependent receptor